MKQHFINIIQLIIEHKQGAFMDQPFINFYFNKLFAPVYLFTSDNYRLGVNNDEYSDNCILHFAGTGIGNSLSKIQLMLSYFLKHIQPKFK
jgi:hypothetical protein